MYSTMQLKKLEEDRVDALKRKDEFVAKAEQVDSFTKHTVLLCPTGLGHWIVLAVRSFLV